MKDLFTQAWQEASLELKRDMGMCNAKEKAGWQIIEGCREYYRLKTSIEMSKENYKHLYGKI